MSTGKGRIWASTGNGGSGRVLGKVGFELVPKKGNPSEYREGGIRASIENVGFGRVPRR